MADIAKIIEEVKSMTVLELSELVKAIEEEFGVSAAAPAVAVAGPAADAGDAGATKDSYDVILASAGEAKMSVIKVVKEITGLGLKESKELVDGAPKPVKEGVSEADAQNFKKQLEDAGATVELK